MLPTRGDQIDVLRSVIGCPVALDIEHSCLVAVCDITIGEIVTMARGCLLNRAAYRMTEIRIHRIRNTY